MEELNQVIGYSSIPGGTDDNTNINVGEISEAPTTITGIHDQEVVPSDSYFNMELGFSRVSDNGLIHAVVKRRNIDDDGKPTGTKHSNPLIDTRAYEIEFIDGTTETLTNKIIAYNLLVQDNEEGHRQLIFG